MKLFAGIIFMLLSMAVSGCVTDSDEPLWSLKPGDAVPEFSVAMSDGSKWNSINPARVCVVTFFNTGCADCRYVLPEIEKASQESRRRGLNDEIDFICIAREESEGRIEEYWLEHGFTLSFSPQTDKTIYSLFANSGIPRVYIINRSSVIIAVFDNEHKFTSDDILQASGF